MRNYRFYLILLSLLTGLSAVAIPPIKVKVAVVYENPPLPAYHNKRIHEVFKTPGYDRMIWNDPRILSADYEKTLEEIAHNTIDYQIVEEIDANRFFTYLKNDPLKRHLTTDEVVKLLSEAEWETLKNVGTSYDYNAMVEHYGFDRKRDNDEIHEVWVWTFPYGGMWESHMMGEGAFWINSKPNENPSCTKLLSVMGLNYERDLACALESYGHRFESTMMQVYGWWDYDSKTKKEKLTTWEKFTAYEQKYQKFDKGNSNIGNIHFPPNGEYDYNWKNEKVVFTYADEWLNYPDVRERKARPVNCSEWGCTHLGYMKWWFSHVPHAAGLNKKDKKLNNWWYYVVDYENALIKENELAK